jgi:hypothetical protein
MQDAEKARLHCGCNGDSLFLAQAQMMDWLMGKFSEVNLGDRPAT